MQHQRTDDEVEQVARIILRHMGAARRVYDAVNAAHEILDLLDGQDKDDD